MLLICKQTAWDSIWDEHSDLRATQLDAMKAYLQSLAEL